MVRGNTVPQRSIRRDTRGNSYGRVSFLIQRVGTFERKERLSGVGDFPFSLSQVAKIFLWAYPPSMAIVFGSGAQPWGMAR
jgi:hypothetical protein